MAEQAGLLGRIWRIAGNADDVSDPDWEARCAQIEDLCHAENESRTGIEVTQEPN